MRPLSDGALARLRAVAEEPDLEGTRYALVGRLGRGGMGSVFRVVDHELQRELALKVLSLPGDDEAVERLRSEARVLARLEHPGIVPVHDVGVLQDGRVYYAMKLVRGRRLDEYARAEPGLPALLRALERVCDAVAFAHDRGVLHRDLKPENVMVGDFGEVLVMDWGVARLADAKAAGEPFGTVLGTPGYMSPEQARGGDVDERTDVYGLGALLYFMLTGTAPLDAEPRLAAAQLSSVPRALLAICRQAMQDDPAARYPSVRALAQDVTRYLEGLRVHAHREGLGEQALRLVRRHSLLVTLVVTYLVIRVVLIFAAR